MPFDKGGRRVQAPIYEIARLTKLVGSIPTASTKQTNT